MQTDLWHNFAFFGLMCFLHLFCIHVFWPYVLSSFAYTSLILFSFLLWTTANLSCHISLYVWHLFWRKYLFFILSFPEVCLGDTFNNMQVSTYSIAGQPVESENVRQASWFWQSFHMNHIISFEKLEVRQVEIFSYIESVHFLRMP